MSAKTAIHMEKLLGWASKLGREESLGISKAVQIILARLMESQVWHQSAGSMALHGGRLRKEIVSSSRPDGSFSQYATGVL